MDLIQDAIDKYKHIRSKNMLQRNYRGKYAFVGVGNHSTSNLYPVLDYLHVRLKYICCKSADKMSLIESAYPGVKATTSLDEILSDEEISGVFVSVSPQAHFEIASRVIRSGKALFVEKPPCMTMDEISKLIEIRRASGFPFVAVGLQKRNAPAIRILKDKVAKSGKVSYNFRYLTGAYPEGNAMMDLFIHPLDCVSYLFGKAEVKCAEPVDGHTWMLVLCHSGATGVLELSTGYSWTDSLEQLIVNTPDGVYELRQMDSLSFKAKPGSFLGLPVEKIVAKNTVTVDLFKGNNFVPIPANNQIVTQGYFDTIKSFLDAVEGKNVQISSSLESVADTFLLLDSLHR